MDVKQISEQIQALASRSEKRSNAAKLREIFDVVESTLLKGIKQTDMLAVLNQNGFSMTLASFRSAIQRIRVDRSVNGNLLGVVKHVVPPFKSRLEVGSGLNQKGGARSSVEGMAENNNRPAPLLKSSKGVWGELNPIAVDGMD